MKHLGSLCILVLVCSHAIAQDARMTARQRSDEPVPPVDHGAALQSMVFYGGDFDERNGLTSERNTAVADSWTFDDFDWQGGLIDLVISNYLDAGIGTPSGADVAIYACLGEGEFGTLVAMFSDASVTTTPTGRSGFGYPEVRMEVELPNGWFGLSAGRYYLGVRPVGTGEGRAFVSTTSGLNSQGSPIANGNTFLQSDYYGVPLPSNWENYLGWGPWDVSYGVDGGGVWGAYVLDVSGTCPGQLKISWAGAPPGKMQAIIYSTGLGHAPLGGPCGTMVSGLASVHIVHPAFSTRSGCGSIYAASTPHACGKYIQLVSLSDSYYPCQVSYVVTVP